MNLTIKKALYDGLISKIVYISYFVYQLVLVFSVSELARNNDSVYRYASIIIIISFCLIIICDFYYFIRGFYSKQEILICLVIGLLLTISLYYYRNVMVIANIFAIMAFKKNDGLKGLKVYFLATCIGFLINILLGIFTEYTGDITQIRYGLERVRYGLGFYYVSVPSFYYFSLVLVYFIINEKISVIKYIIIFIINFVLFYFTDTKAPFIYVNLIILSHIIIFNIKSKLIEKIFNIIVLISYPLSFLGSYLLSYFYNANDKVFSLLNNILTGRLNLTHNAIKLLPLSFFGQNLGVYSLIYDYYIDSSLISMMYNNGILVLIISLIFITYFCYISYKTKNKSLMLALLFVAIRSSFDFGFMALQLSPFVILFMNTYEKYCKNNK